MTTLEEEFVASEQRELHEATNGLIDRITAKHEQRKRFSEDLLSLTRTHLANVRAFYENREDSVTKHSLLYLVNQADINVEEILKLKKIDANYRMNRDNLGSTLRNIMHILKP